MHSQGFEHRALVLGEKLLISYKIRVLHPDWVGVHGDVLRWARILVQVTTYRRLLICRDGNLDQSEAYDI